MKALLVISANNTSSKRHISEHINEQAISIDFPSLFNSVFFFLFLGNFSEFEWPEYGKNNQIILFYFFLGVLIFNKRNH